MLRDVRRAVIDFEPMQGAVFRMIKAAKESGARYDQAEVTEAVAFLEWLLDDNFVFLGYREYEMVDSPEGRAVTAIPSPAWASSPTPGSPASPSRSCSTTSTRSSAPATRAATWW